MNLTTFDFHGTSLRVLTGPAAELWFIAADVCRALGLQAKKGTYGHHLAKLDADEVTPLSNSGVKLSGTGMHNAKLVSEPGLYKLLQSSRTEPAQKFDRWYRHEVLPAIRKTGGYIMGEEKVRTGEMSEDAAPVRPDRCGVSLAEHYPYRG